MGLCLTVYTEVELVKDSEDVECPWEWIDEQDNSSRLTYLHANPHFPKHFNSSGVYSFKESKTILSRSYSGWSNLRDILAKACDYPPITLVECVARGWDYEEAKIRPYQSKVFYELEGLLHELINFSDCEGTIGAELCKKIHRDLCDVGYIEEAIDIDAFNNLVTGFALAVDNNGVVGFS